MYAERSIFTKETTLGDFDPGFASQWHQTASAHWLWFVWKPDVSIVSIDWHWLPDLFSWHNLLHFLLYTALFRAGWRLQYIHLTWSWSVGRLQGSFHSSSFVWGQMWLAGVSWETLRPTSYWSGPLEPPTKCTQAILKPHRIGVSSLPWPLWWWVREA